MQRDIGNEIIVAIVVVGVLAFALTFAIILSLSSGTTAAGVLGTPQAVALTETSPAPEGTALAGESDRIVETATISPETPTLASSTNMSAAQSPSPTNTATRTQEPTASAPAAQTAEPTRQPNPTQTLIETATPSSTSTHTPTVTASPSPTPTRTPTPQPTATPTLMSTRQPTATHTPTVEPTMTPTATEASSPMPTATATPEPALAGPRVFCIAPFGWRPYVVQTGDTLTSIARATGSNLLDLQVANCLDRTVTIVAGDVVYVPRLPGEPVQTAAPSQAVNVTPVGELQPAGCANPNAIISEPAARARVGTRFAVRGTAAGNNFGYYALEVRSDFVTVYTPYLTSTQPVVNGELGVIDRGTVFAPGVYWIRLSVFDQAGGINTARCAIPVYFE